jgi:hypothetical protein
MKQETLEETAEKYSKNWEEITGLDYENSVPSEVNKIDFINGAKWQAERMYSEVKVFTEELMDKIDSFEYSVNQNSYISDYVKEWFEQIKKK